MLQYVATRCNILQHTATHCNKFTTTTHCLYYRKPQCVASCDTSAWVLLNLRIRSVVHLNESCHTYEPILSHMWTDSLIHVNRFCYTCKQILSHMRRNFVTDVSTSCATFGWVLSHPTTATYYNTHDHCNTLQHTATHCNCTCVTGLTHIWMRPVTYVDESYHTSATHPIIGLFCRISSLLSGSFAKETYNLIDPTCHTCATHSYVRHDSSTSVTRLNRR